MNCSKRFEGVRFFALNTLEICIGLTHMVILNQKWKQHPQQMESDHLSPCFKQHMVEGKEVLDSVTFVDNYIDW